MPISPRRLFVALLACVLLPAGCEEPVYTPKPRAYPRVVYPTRAYQPFDRSYCAFTFEYPRYATIEQDTAFFDDKPANTCWFNVYFPDFNARVHCSYYPVTGRSSFDKLVADAHELANKHNLKANYIDEFRIEKPNHVSGFCFNIEGPAASPFQFYLTDSTRHFLRGALYFNTQARPDSLAPVFDFLKQDIMQMVNTFSWNGK